MTTEPQAARLGTRGGVSLERGRHYAPNARGAGAEKKGRIIPEIRVFRLSQALPSETQVLLEKREPHVTDSVRPYSPLSRVTLVLQCLFHI